MGFLALVVLYLIRALLLTIRKGLSFNFLGILLLTHVFTPSAQPFTSKFITLSGYNPTTGKYGVNQGDIGFVTFCIVLFSGIRAGSMKYVLTPLARHWGVTKNKDITRFSEQGWMLMYNTVFWTLGMVGYSLPSFSSRALTATDCQPQFIYSNSAYFLNLDELWTNWPKRELDGLTKFYTLAQGAYWTQQLLVVNLEARRQDYWQMIVHHLATMTLIASAYAYHQTRVANLILVLMDAIELLFPVRHVESDHDTHLCYAPDN